MLDWINVLLWLFGSVCLFFVQAPLYDSVSAGTVLIAITVIGIIIDFCITRVK